MKEPKDVALEYFAAGYNCAEAVLLAVAGALDVKPDHLPRIATGFGGGVAGCGEICGALSGAVMALGLKHGRTAPADQDAKRALYARAQELMQDFQEEFGNIRCLSLTGCNLSTPEGLARAQELDLHHSFCPKFVSFATECTVQMLEDEEEQER